MIVRVQATPCKQGTVERTDPGGTEAFQQRESQTGRGTVVSTMAPPVRAGA